MAFLYAVLAQFRQFLCTVVFIFTKPNFVLKCDPLLITWTFICLPFIKVSTITMNNQSDTPIVWQRSLQRQPWSDKHIIFLVQPQPYFWLKMHYLQHIYLSKPGVQRSFNIRFTSNNHFQTSVRLKNIKLYLCKAQFKLSFIFLYFLIRN